MDIEIRTAKGLTNQAKYHESLMRTFWRCWRKEYLTNLCEFHNSKKAKRPLTGSKIEVGDVVLVHDNLPRNQWKLAIVNSLIPGRDGLVRAVRLRMSNGNELQRPIEKLYPLEVSEATLHKTTNEKELQTSEVKAKLPMRIAAQQALKRIKQQAEQDEH